MTDSDSQSTHLANWWWRHRVLVVSAAVIAALALAVYAQAGSPSGRVTDNGPEEPGKVAEVGDLDPETGSSLDINVPDPEQIPQGELSADLQNIVEQAASEVGGQFSPSGQNALAGLTAESAADYRESDGSTFAEVLYELPDGGVIMVIRQPLESDFTIDVYAIDPEGNGYEVWPDGTEAVVRSHRMDNQVVFFKGDTMINIGAGGDSGNPDSVPPLTLDELRLWAQAISAYLEPLGPGQ